MIGEFYFFGKKKLALLGNNSSVYKQLGNHVNKCVCSISNLSGFILYNTFFFHRVLEMQQMKYTNKYYNNYYYGKVKFKTGKLTAPKSLVTRSAAKNYGPYIPNRSNSSGSKTTINNVINVI